MAKFVVVIFVKTNVKVTVKPVCGHGCAVPFMPSTVHQLGKLHRN